jgi:hypothetical protein
VNRARAAELGSTNEADQSSGDQPEGEHEESRTVAEEERRLYN